jgi:hypothetical protein
MKNEKFYDMPFLKIYNLYIQKAERKGRTKQEVDAIIFWLFGYDENSLQVQLDQENSIQTFYDEAPSINENASMIKGVVCGVRVEEVEEELMRHIRYLDKLVDELAKGKTMEKILRK